MPQHSKNQPHQMQ